MSKSNKKAASSDGSDTKRYRSLAQVKRDLFPKVVAAEETGGFGRRWSDEDLMADFFGPKPSA